jgi:NADPH:quinone reductase-like Zn-dependent oxidoreductase
MLHRGGVGAERVLITGASGGVGSAAIQLAKRRGAEVLAISGAEKAAAVAEIGADEVIERGADLVAAVGSGTVDAVLDLVAGSTFPDLLTTLVPGGRYITSGAIAGPLVELDVRTLYLKDLTFYGSTFQPDEVFENLVRYVGAGEIQPLVAGTYDLSEIVTAQQDFLTKRHVGKLVLVPPAVG